MDVERPSDNLTTSAISLSPAESYPDEDIPIAQAVKHPTLAHAVTDIPLPIEPQFDLVEQAMQLNLTAATRQCLNTSPLAPTTDPPHKKGENPI